MTEMGFKPSVTPTLTSFPNALLSNILTHVKVQSTLRLNMKRLPSETEQFFLIITAINNVFLTFPLSFKPPPRQLLWTQNLYIQLPLLDVWKVIIIYVLKQTNTLFLKIQYLPILRISANVDTSPFFTDIPHHLHTTVNYFITLFPKSLKTTYSPLPLPNPKPHHCHVALVIPRAFQVGSDPYSLQSS